MQPTRPQPPPVDPNRCAACGQYLSGRYFTLIDRPERYCQQCIASRPRCTICGAPLGAQHWHLHDGRTQCATCHATAVYDPAEAQQLFHQTVGALIQQFGMSLNVGVDFRLLDRYEFRQIRQELNSPLAEDQLLLGMYARRGLSRTVFMLYGLPRLMFRITVAHEYAHAWQTENCPLLRDDVLREGFAEWVAYHHLIWLGCHKAAKRMLAEFHPYRPALDYVLDLEQRMGMLGVVEYIKRAD